MIGARGLGLTRLLQLASAALPVGAYSYSQGLEAAVNAGIVHDESSAHQWIADVLEFSIARMDTPLLLRLQEAWRSSDLAAASTWNSFYLATRESAELRAETAQMGYSLARLLGELGESGGFATWDEVSFPAAYSYAAVRWNVDRDEALIAYLWSWAENQTLAAVKAVPLGQTAGQRVLLEIGSRIALTAEHASALDDEALGNYAPGLALLSAHHETQYSRLFRS